MKPSPSTRPDRLAFFPGIAEKLEAYVYLLIDPRDDEIFYVGKGRGDRAWQHARGRVSGTPKFDRIRAIQRRGSQVRVEVLRHRMTDDTAHAVEAAAIDLLRLGLSGKHLTNAVSGHDSRECGWISMNDLRARYGAEPARVHPQDRLMLVRINKAFRSEMTEEELYEATRQWWRLDPLRNQPTVALAVFNGVVRRAYRIHPGRWRRRTKDGRWRFSGEPTPELARRYEWRDVSRFVAAGSQNPISYINCTPTGVPSPSVPMISVDEPEDVPKAGVIGPEDRVVLIRISQAFQPNMSERELYQTTREWWRMDPIRRKPALALAVFEGEVQRVYRIERWEQRAKDRRWRFTGRPADDKGARYEGMDVSQHWKQGAQNPITYVNCPPE